MKEEKTIILNEKGIVLTVIIVLCLTFALGFTTSSKRQKNDITIFTREDLDRIDRLQKMEDKEESEAEIYAYKDENGKLMIGWNY